MEIKRKHIGYLVLGLGIIGLILANFSDLISTNDATAANFGEHHRGLSLLVNLCRHLFRWRKLRRYKLI